MSSRLVQSITPPPACTVNATDICASYTHPPEALNSRHHCIFVRSTNVCSACSLRVLAPIQLDVGMKEISREDRDMEKVSALLKCGGKQSMWWHKAGQCWPEGRLLFWILN